MATLKAQCVLGSEERNQTGSLGRVLTNMLLQIQQFCQRPDVIGYSGFHGRGYTQRSMHNAKVVMGKVEAERRLNIFQLPRECQRQAGESGKAKSQRQVVSFYKAGRDVSWVRIPASCFGYNLRDSWWGLSHNGSLFARIGLLKSFLVSPRKRRSRSTKLWRGITRFVAPPQPINRVIGRHFGRRFLRLCPVDRNALKFFAINLSRLFESPKGSGNRCERIRLVGTKIESFHSQLISHLGACEQLRVAATQSLPNRFSERSHHHSQFIHIGLPFGVKPRLCLGREQIGRRINELLKLGDFDVDCSLLIRQSNYFFYRLFDYLFVFGVIHRQEYRLCL
jgi:hypothetical protein